MKPHVTLAIMMTGLAVGLSFAGCTVPVDDVDETTGVATAESARPDYHFYTIRKNYDCTIRLCTGYMIKEINTARAVEQHVDGLRFLEPEVEGLALAAERAIPDGGLVLRGFVGAPFGPWEKRALVISEAYRGMPGFTPENGDAFYTLDLRQRPHAFMARAIDTDVVENIVRLDVTNVIKPNVEVAWLYDRAVSHGAIVAGHMHRGSFQAALDANQVFLRLPDKQECAVPRDPCGEDGVAAYHRDQDRCLVFEHCMPMIQCYVPIPGRMPNYCADGYTQVRWTAHMHGCTDFACEPDFIQ